MLRIDPTYLRYIYDDLIKGSVHPGKASELPDGLIGLYEEAFEDCNSVIERQNVLKQFALFTLERDNCCFYCRVCATKIKNN